MYSCNLHLGPLTCLDPAHTKDIPTINPGFAPSECESSVFWCDAPSLSSAQGILNYAVECVPNSRNKYSVGMQVWEVHNETLGADEPFWHLVTFSAQAHQPGI